MNDNLLPLYYDKAFPVQDFFRWLNHSVTPSLDFVNRELSFTIKEDVLLRYMSYSSSDAFKRDLKRLLPKRIEVGPVYTHDPRQRKTITGDSFKPVSKELVFDIDLTDYNTIRTCCKNDVCIKCWQFITVAIDVLERALRQDFGFEHILWVYSGRRGAHAWVCDAKARALTDTQRSAIVQYLNIFSGDSIARLPAPLHPHLEASYELLKPHFYTNILIDQNPWKDPESEATKKLYKKLEDGGIKLAVSQSDSSAKWAKVESLINSKRGTDKFANLEHLLKSIVLEYMYPRLDINVSNHRNHLLKSPFSVHPATGFVCVPIDVPNHARFDPKASPTITQVFEEYDDNDSMNGTSLAPYLQIFNKFVVLLLKSEKRPVESIDF